MRNYDTTTHNPYPRITAINITYSKAGVPEVIYVEQQAVVDGDGHVQHLSDTPVQKRLDLSGISEPVQIVHPATGAAIPGMTVTSQQLMLGLLAFVRADQKRLDQENDQSQVG